MYYLALSGLVPSTTLFPILHIGNLGTRAEFSAELPILQIRFSMLLLLHIRNVGGRRIQAASKQIEFQRLLFNLVGLRSSVGARLGVGGRHLWFEQVLDFLNRLPWLRSLFSSGDVGELRLEHG